MINTEKLCMGCMAELDEHLTCSRCGPQLHKQRNALALPLKTILHKRFLVGRILGNPGGFGITYLVWDMLLDTTAAIKEYLPLSSVSRQSDNSTVRVNSKQDRDYFKKGLSIFLKEAKILAQFSHPNIVRIRDCFSCNNTAYLVMEYHEGAPLDEIITNSGGYLSEQKALDIMLPILEGLDVVHSKDYLHRDIKPQNIYITKKGIPLLLDFGASRIALADTDQTLTVMLSGGYAPFEQYHEKGKQGPWGDIYSAGATLYYMVTGQKPSNAIERQQSDELAPPIRHNPKLTESFSLAIMKAMSINPLARPQNIQAFKQILTAHSFLLPTTSHSPAVFDITGDLPVESKRPRNKKTIVNQQQIKKTNRGLGRYFIYLALAVVLWISWSTRQMLEENNSNQQQQHGFALNPVILEPKIIPAKSVVDNIDFNPVPTQQPELSGFSEERKSEPLNNTSRQTKLIQQPKNTQYFQPPIHPPEVTIKACQYKRLHSHCSFDTPLRLEHGVCLQNNTDQLTCIPERVPQLRPLPRPRQRPPR